MDQILLATRNAKKLLELQRILGDAMPGVAVLGLDDVESFPETPETEPTFLGNALLKARAACTATGLISIADDSGLCVDALNGMPGVLSARWSGGDDAANLLLVLSQIEDVPNERRGASFVCAAVAVFPDGLEITAEGRVEGGLIRVPRGEHGFGYDPIFVPHGSQLTTAEMAAEAKDAISHRGKALRSLASALA